MNIPQPVPVQRPGGLNPIENAASYASRILAGINAGTDIAPAPKTQSMTMGRESRNPVTSISTRQQMVKDSASRQHQLKLAGLQKSRQGGLGLPSGGGGGGAAKPRGGYKGAFSGGIHGLTPGAGAALSKLNAAYKAQWGHDLKINSGGRSSEQQAHLYNLYLQGKGNLAAPPGSSVHESGRAVDFGGSAHNYSPQHTWLVNNGPKFGWLWAGKNFSQVEPWHFEFNG